MTLDEGQKKRVTEWIEEGLKLSDIQSRLASEFNLRLTYMEMRFLLADHGLQPKDKPAPAPPVEIGKTAPAAPAAAAAAPLSLDTTQPPVPMGGVSVSVDAVTRPGTMVSGKVTFTDGKGAEWYLDQMGRLGLVAKEQGYKPSQEDLIDFQDALQGELAKLGY